MTRNWNPETIRSVTCKFGCGRILFWNMKGFYADGPDSNSPKHVCCNTEKTLPIPVILNDLSRQMVSLGEAIDLARKANWENGQKAEEYFTQIKRELIDLRKALRNE